jgi:hypothetical protein
MMHPMNEWEIAQGILCDACSEPATHCDSEVTDFLLLCSFHAFEHAMMHGGTVKSVLLTNPDSTVEMPFHASR